MAMKGQIVAGFITKFTNMEGQGAEECPQWSIHTDELSNSQAGGDGIVLHSVKGDEIECMVCLDFPTTNNETEHEALVAGLDLTRVAKATNVIVYCDSQVVTSQVNGNYECKGERMKKYLEQVKKRMNDLQTEFVQIPREENEQAGHLAKAVSIEYMLIPNQVLSFVQISPLIDDVGVQEISSKSSWTTSIISYLKDGMMLDSKEATRKLKV